MASKVLKLNELTSWCSELAKNFKEKQIVLLDGALGAGKTELVKTIVQLMGGKESSSPTYSLINEYTLKDRQVYHVDLYRIKGEEDLESIGFWDLFEGEKALIFIEWSERLNEKELPFDFSILRINIQKRDDTSVREYTAQ